MVHGEGDRGNGGIEHTIVGFEGEAVSTVEIGHRHIAETAVGIERQRAVGGVGDFAEGQRIGIHIGCGHRAGEGGVLIAAGTASGGDRGLVDVVHREGDRGHVGVQHTIVGLEGEAVGAVEVGHRHVAEAAVGIERQRAVRRASHREIGQGIGIHIGCSHGAGEGGVFVARRSAADRHRCLVHVVHRESDRGHVGIRLSVIGLEGEAVSAVVIGRRHIAVAAVAIQSQRAVHGACHLAERQRIEFHIGCGHRAGEGGVLVAAGTAASSDRGLVDVVHREGDRGNVGVQHAIVGLEGEAVGAVEVRHRHIAEAAVAVQRQRAVRGTAHFGEGQGIAVHIRRRDKASDRGVLVARNRGVGGHGRLVHMPHREGDRGNVGVQHAIVGFEGEAVGAVEVGRRCVAETAIGIERQRAMGGTAYFSEGQGIDIHVGRRHGAGDRGVFVTSGSAIGGYRGLIHVAHRERDGRRIGVRVAVIGLEGEAVSAVEIGRRHVTVAAVAVEGQRAVGGTGDLGEGQCGALGVRRGSGAGEGGVLIANGRAVGSHWRRIEGRDHHLRRGRGERRGARLRGLHGHGTRTAECEDVASHATWTAEHRKGHGSQSKIRGGGQRGRAGIAGQGRHAAIKGDDLGALHHGESLAHRCGGRIGSIAVLGGLNGHGSRGGEGDRAPGQAGDAAACGDGVAYGQTTAAGGAQHERGAAALLRKRAKIEGLGQLAGAAEIDVKGAERSQGIAGDVQCRAARARRRGRIGDGESRARSGCNRGV